MADQLDAIGAPVTDEDIAMTLLCSLPEQYDPLIVALEARPSAELTSDFVGSRLLGEEKRKQESFNVKVNAGSESAFISNNQSSGMKFNNKAKFCAFCKKFRHTEDACYLKHGYPIGHPLHGKRSKGSGNEHAAVSELGGNGHDQNPTGESDGSDDHFAFTTQLDKFTKHHNDWFLDSAASSHYCNNREAFASYQSIPPRNVTLGDNRIIQAIGIGIVPVKLIVNGITMNGVCTETLHVPTMGYNLVSVSKLTKAGLGVSFNAEAGIITTKSGKILARAPCTNAGLYRLPFQLTSLSTAEGDGVLEIIGGGEELSILLPSNDLPGVEIEPEEVKSDGNEIDPPSPPVVPQPSVTSPTNVEATNMRRSGRSRRSPDTFWDLQSQQPPPSVLLTTLRDDYQPLYALAVNHEINTEPLTFKEAAKRSDAHLWMQAAKDEIDSIQAADTWTLVPLPDGRVPIGCKWTFKIKHHADGSVDRYKARLCAKGYSQQQGIDYTETFAPVAKFSSIRSLLALAAHYDLEVHQMDVKTAFLNGDLEEDIYMVQPEGFVVKGKEAWMCKLNKSLYGLKQASRAWYQKMDQALQNLEFIRLYADPCINVLRTSELVIFLSLYVDDLLLVSNSLENLSHLKQQLSKKFEMKDLGEAHFVLGIQIERNRKARTLSICQQQYIKNVVERFNMSESKPVSTPLYLGSKHQDMMKLMGMIKSQMSGSVENH